MNKTKKFLTFLDFVVKNQKFCVNQVARKFGISPKTIQRYKKEIEEFFEVKFQSYQKGCYTLPTTQKLKSLLLDSNDVKAMSHLLEILALLEGQRLEQFDIDKDLLRLVPEDVYHLKEYPFEELKTPHLKKIKESILRRRYTDILYDPGEIIHIKKAKPHKLVFAQGNWYVAVLTDDEINHGFKFLRVNFIKDYQLRREQFKRDLQVLHFIKHFRTLFSSYMEPDFFVRVLVSTEVARHFRYKHHIEGQRILKEHKNGSLELGFTINNEMEILLLAKQWLPHMKILEPANLQEELEKMCKNFLEGKT